MPSKNLPAHHKPNAETLEAMQELQTGGGKSFSSVAELMADLNDDEEIHSTNMSL